MTFNADIPVELQEETAKEPDQDELQYWDRWRGNGDETARAFLIDRHMPYAKTVAAVYYRRRAYQDIEFGDYLQFASIGLMEALDRFDPSRAVAFRSYAARRMHGAILNGVERLTDRNQQLALRRRIDKERASSFSEALFEPDNGETKGEALFERLAEIGIGFALGILLEETGMVSSTSDHPETDAMPHDSPLQISYFRHSEIRHLRRLVNELLHSLTPSEKAVIRHHYLQEVDFGEIARCLGVSRGRVSQLHRSGLARLRAEIGRRQLCDVVW